MEKKIATTEEQKSTCTDPTEEMNWGNAKIVGQEQRWTQRKYLEGIESPREKNKGITKQLQPTGTMAEYTVTIFSKKITCFLIIVVRVSNNVFIHFGKKKTAHTQ